MSLDQTDATFVDESAPKPVTVAVAPLNLHLKDVTSNFTKPFGIDIDGTLNRKGTFKVTGTAAIAPLKADLRVGTKRLDLTFADPYVSSRLNASYHEREPDDGRRGRTEQQRKDFLVSYKGDAALGSVRMLDKLTNDLFFRMNALNVNRIDFALGKGPPKVHVGLIALNDFYSRIILNKDGKLNLKDITANPQEAPTSLTRATGEPGSKGAVPVAASPTPTPAAAPSVGGRYRSWSQPGRRGESRTTVPGTAAERRRRAEQDHSQGRQGRLHRQLHQAQLHCKHDRHGGQRRRVRDEIDCARAGFTRRKNQRQLAAQYRRIDQSARADRVRRYQGEGGRGRADRSLAVHGQVHRLSDR